MSLIIIFVNDIGIGLIFAIFHSKVTHCCCIKEFNILVSTGARYCEKNLFTNSMEDLSLNWIVTKSLV